MMPKLKVIMVLMIVSGFWLNPVLGSEANERFAEGIKKYQEKDYTGSEAIWSAILKETPTDASALLNQALTFSQQKKWGLALAYLRQAQILEPRNSTIQQAYDYAVANIKSRGFRQEDSLLNSFEFHLGKYFLLPEILLTHWTFSLLLLIVSGQLFRARRRAQQQGLNLPPWRPWQWALSGTWVFLSLLLLLKIASTIDQKATVTRSGSAPIRSAPMAEAAELGDLPEGALVSVRDFYQDWVQVRFDRMPVGWLQRQDLLLLTPEGFR